MNYLEWNNAIINHFFNTENEDKEVMLYFSESIIEEIGRKNFPEPDISYVDDFYRALKNGVSGIPNQNYIDRIKALEEKYSKGCRAIGGINFQYPPQLTYILTFMLPFTSAMTDNELNVNNFHGNVKTFFEEKELTAKYNSHIKNRLTEIDSFWSNLNNWLNNLNCGSLGFIEEINPPDQRKFVGKFEYHILFRKDQEELLAALFDKKDILPGQTMKEEVIRKLMVENHSDLKLSINTREILKNPVDYIGNKIIKRALSFYNHWDGTIYTINGKRGYSRGRLVLCLNIIRINFKVDFKYFRIFSKDGIPDGLSLKDKKGNKFNDVYQVNRHYSNPVHCFRDIESAVQLVDQAARIKYNWLNKDFYLFKAIPEFDWVEIQQVDFHSSPVLIICKKDFYENRLKNWFDTINPADKKLKENIKETNLPEGWLILSVTQISSYPHPEIPELIPDYGEQPQISFDKSFYFEGVLFRDKLPVITLENTENFGIIVARYEDKSEIPLIQIEREYEGQKQLINPYQFTDQHKIEDNLNKPFKLICGDISTHRFLRISDFNKKTNKYIDNLLPKRDLLGQVNDACENYFKGLEHFFKTEKIISILPIQNLLSKTFDNQTESSIFGNNDIYDSLRFGNILLHYISTKGKIKKSELNEAFISLLENRNENQENLKKHMVSLGYQLQEMGYVDYDSNQSTYYINKPSLIVIPTISGYKLMLTGARDPKLITSLMRFCNEDNGIKIRINSCKQNVRDEILPQTVFLNLRKKNEEIVRRLSKEFDLIFLKDKLHTQFALTVNFPNTRAWQDYLEKISENEISDTDGGYLFDINSLSFIEKQNNFDKELALVKYTNINGFRTIYRLWYRETCYEVTDQQIGIQVFLFLYTQLRSEKYNLAIQEKGRINSYQELEMLMDAQKKTNNFIYDRDNMLFAVPLSCRLPKYFSMSLQLMSGTPPEIHRLKYEDLNIDRLYLVFKNVSFLFLSNQIINKFGNERHIANRFINRQIKT